MLITFSFITAGIFLIWISAEKLEKYSVLSASKLGISPFLIGSTVIALGTSAPEMLTSLFAAMEEKGSMVVGNVIGSNIANLSLVFGLTLFILALNKEKIIFDTVTKSNLVILLFSTLVVTSVIILNPFTIFSVFILILSLCAIIYFWHLENKTQIGTSPSYEDESFLLPKLLSSLIVLIFAAWLITEGALMILEDLQLGELFIGYTVLAIGTSLPEIAATIALAMKGRYATVAGTLIGSNIFNGLFVLAIPGLIIEQERLFFFLDWIFLLGVLLAITFLFCFYLFSRSKIEKKANIFISVIFLSIYFLSLILAY